MFIVDNGYLSWFFTIPPSSNGTTYEIIRFSEWLESMRKDIECTFGIMKCRFAILKYGLRFQNIAKCDETWLTCCALHNLLLHNDGLCNNWDISDDGENHEIPFAMSRLDQPTSHPNNSNSTTRVASDDSTAETCRLYTEKNYRIVKDMPMELLKRCLVNHFDIRFQKNDIKWPTRKDN